MVQLASEGVEKTRALKLIVLDRDGTINHDSEQFIKSPDEWRPIPGSLEAWWVSMNGSVQDAYWYSGMQGWASYQLAPPYSAMYY